MAKLTVFVDIPSLDVDEAEVGRLFSEAAIYALRDKRRESQKRTYNITVSPTPLPSPYEQGKAITAALKDLAPDDSPR